MKADFLTHLAALPQPPGGDYPHGTPFVRALGHGSMSVELFVPAGAPHHFEDFSQDFVTWVVFYDPPEGEKP